MFPSHVCQGKQACLAKKLSEGQLPDKPEVEKMTKTLINDVGDKRAPINLERMERCIRDLVGIPTSDPPPGFTKYADATRELCLKRAFVKDNGAFSSSTNPPVLVSTSHGCPLLSCFNRVLWSHGFSRFES